MQKEAFEPTGLIPRSIIRTVDRFLQQLLPGKEKIAIQEYRVSRYQILVSIKSLLIIISTPLIVNYTLKALLLTPLTEHFWNSNQGEIFLNQYQEKRAFAEMQDFSEKMFFELLSDQSSELLVTNVPTQNNSLAVKKVADEVTKLDKEMLSKVNLNVDVDVNLPIYGRKQSGRSTLAEESDAFFQEKIEQSGTSRFAEDSHTHQTFVNASLNLKQADILADISKTAFQAKSLELAKSYNKQSILAITNLLGDFVTFLTVCSLFRIMRPEIIILKSFLTESVYSLSDTTKSFLLILGMDLLVGFHSPRGWEIVLEGLLRHIGLPENENFVLLFVALFPVFLDTVFKYWIFRYLNKISPSTVVTYHSMIE